VRDIRRFGAAALDLAWTAAGRYDVFYERGLKAWDLAAGGLLCRRAGLEVVLLDPVPPLPAGVLVAPPRLVEPVLALLD
jgi:myo-inositol-1(or 4)-monophosphatase